MPECLFCNVTVKNESALRLHYNTNHQGLKPYVCECGVKFGHRASLMRHKTNNCKRRREVGGQTPLKSEGSGPPPPVGVWLKGRVEKRASTNTHRENSENEGSDTGDQPPPSPSSSPATGESTKRRKLNPALFDTYPDFKCGVFSNVPSFAGWIQAYNERTRNTSDVRIATSTSANMQACIQNIILRKFPALLETACPMLFSDEIDSFIDIQLKSVSHITVTQRLRYVRWYHCYLIGKAGYLDMGIMEELDSAIRDMQSASTGRTTNESLLSIMDPYELVGVANQVVAMLRTNQVDVIDPFISRFFSNPSGFRPESLVRFGNEHMKCWLELVMRFVNVPLRIQATTGLCMPNTRGDMVSRLSIGMDRISRVIQYDKMGERKQAVSVPLDRTISGYLLFYIVYCRPDAASQLVFQSKLGREWKRASKDLKGYLCSYGVDCGALCPNGRFIHMSRNIGIACFSVLSGFDIAKIRNYCTLLRHQLIHVEHIYSPWMKLCQSQDAGVHLLSLRGTPCVEPARGPHSTKLVSIRAPTGVVKTGFASLFYRHALRINSPVVVRNRDVSTQTSLLESATTSSGVVDRDNGVARACDDTVRQCVACGGVLDVMGPVGLSRSKFFGRYYIQCDTCHGKCPGKATEFFDLGVRPVRKSVSSKPRNFEAISSYVKQKTGRVW